MENCRRSVILLLLVLFIMVPSGEVWANDLLPGEKVDSPFYEQHKPSHYRIDYVPNEDPSGIAETMEVQFFLFLNILLNVVWSIYVFFVEFAMRIVNWAFSKELTNNLIDILNELFPSLENSLWDNLWFLGASVSILGAVLLWGYGKTQKSIMVLAGMILLLAVVPSILANLPAWLKTTNSVATDIGGQVLVRTVKADVNGMYGSIDTHEETRLRRLQQSNPEAYEKEMNKRREEELEQSQKRGIHAVDDAIWKSLVYEPYLIANFDGKKKGEKYFKGLMAHGDNDKERRNYLRHGGEEKSYKWIKEDGTAKNKDLKTLTQAGFPDRAINVLVSVGLGAIPLIALVIFSFLCLYWTGIAMGFAILGVIYLLLAFWPGFGWGEVGHWLYRTFSALLMKVFYSIVLAIFLATWNLIQPGGSKMQDLGLGGRIIVIVFLLLGFWTATEALRKKWNSPPGLQGGSMGGGDGVGSNDMGMALGRTMKIAGMAGKGLRGLGRLNRHRTQRRSQRQIRDAHTENSEMLKRMKKDSGGTGADKKPGQRFKFNSRRRVDSGMSKEAKGTFRQMKEKGYDPTQQEDRARWVGDQPEDAKQVAEIGKWSHRMPDQVEKYSDFDGNAAPPEKPAENTPEFEVWDRSPRWRQHWGLYQTAKKEVDQRHKSEYRDRYQKYEKSISRFVRRPPRYIRPSDRSYLKEYRGMLRKSKDKGR